MRNLIRGTSTVLVVSVAVGSLALGSTVTAGAATASAHAHSHAHVHQQKHHFSLATFKCGHADRVLARIRVAQAHIAAGLPKLTAREHVASAAGHARRAARIKKRISRRESPKFKAWLSKVVTGIEAKCHVSAPPTAASSPTPGTTQT